MNLLILGAGQYGMVAKEIAESINEFEKIHFLDDKKPTAIGRLNDFNSFVASYECAFVAIGNPDIRSDYIERLLKAGFRLPNLLSPKAYISSSVNLSQGIIVEPMAVIHTNAVINRGCIISAGAVINHNCVLGECCHIDCNSTVTRSAVVPPKTKINSGTVYNS